MLSEVMNGVVGYLRSDYITISIVVLLFATVQFVLFFYFNKNYPLILTAVVSLAVAIFTAYLTYFLVNYGKPLDEADYLVPILLSVAIFAVSVITITFVSYGPYLLADYLKSDSFNRTHFYLWLFLVFMVPLSGGLLSLHDYYQKLLKESQEVQARLSVSYRSDMPIYIDKIEFYNSVNKLKSEYELDNELVLSEKHNVEIEKYYDKRVVIVGASGNFIPKNSDQFIMSWYSFVEGKYYSDIFPFKYEKFIDDSKDKNRNLNIMQIIFPCLRKEFIHNIHLHFKMRGDVDIFVQERWKRMQANYYIKVEDKVLDEKKKDHFVSEYLRRISDDKEKIKFVSMINNKKQMGILSDEKGFTDELQEWSLNITGRSLDKYIDYEDSHMNRYVISIKNLLKYVKRPLPDRLTLECVTGEKIIVVINSSKLYELFYTLKIDDKVDVILGLDNVNIENASLTIKQGTKMHSFEDFYIKIQK